MFPRFGVFSFHSIGQNTKNCILLCIETEVVAALRWLNEAITAIWVPNQIMSLVHSILLSFNVQLKMTLHGKVCACARVHSTLRLHWPPPLSLSISQLRTIQFSVIAYISIVMIITKDFIALISIAFGQVLPFFRFSFSHFFLLNSDKSKEKEKKRIMKPIALRTYQVARKTN